MDFVQLAKSQGVPGERVIGPEGIAGAFQRGLDATHRGESCLLDVVIACTGNGANSTWH